MEEEKDNPPLWFMIAGIIIVSLVAIFVMLGPTREYTQKNQYYLNDAQSKVIYKSSVKNDFLNYFKILDKNLS